MSMPQSIAIVIVSSDRARLEEVHTFLDLPTEGICPKYYFVTPDDDVENVVNPKGHPFGHVDLWIAIDRSASLFCK